jgi:hypothetical protein
MDQQTLNRALKVTEDLGLVRVAIPLGVLLLEEREYLAEVAEVLELILIQLMLLAVLVVPD